MRSVQFFRLGFSSHTTEGCLQPPRSLFRNVYRRILAVALRDSGITARDRQEKLLRQRTIHKLVVCLSGSFDQRPALAAGCFFLARSIVLGGVCVKLPWFEQGLLTARSPHPLVKFHGLFPSTLTPPTAPGGPCRPARPGLPCRSSSIFWPGSPASGSGQAVLASRSPGPDQAGQARPSCGQAWLGRQISQARPARPDNLGRTVRPWSHVRRFTLGA